MNMGNENQFSFLVTTDSHLGFKENDSIRAKDSFVAFEEALELAVKNNVDFILLGGDLFHVNRPSLPAITKCSKIIRKYSLADDSKRATFIITSGDLSHSGDLKQANFESSSFNVACPIFTIHGNHDDPTGPDPLCVCKTFATSGLLNYFGCCDSSTQIRVKPIILKKGDIVLAIYGIGFIPDQKLRSFWTAKRIVFDQPPPDAFNILVLHQNRVCHDESRHIPDEFAPSFFNLIIRGHEHDALEPENLSETTVVYQPGSTVATSLTHGEAIPKKVAIMKIQRSSSEVTPFKLTPELINLNTCRNIYVKDLSYAEVKRYVDIRMKEVTTLTPPKIAEFTRDYAFEVIQDILKKHSSAINGKGKFAQPLIRLRIEFVDKEHRFNVLDFGREFHPSQVANRDIVLFMKSKIRIRNGTQVNLTFESDGQTSDDDETEFEIHDSIDIKQMKRVNIDTIIHTYFDEKPENQKLKVLSTKMFSRVIREIDDRGDVISKVVNEIKDKIKRKFEASLISEEHSKMYFNDEVRVKQKILDLLEESRQELAGRHDL